MPALAAKVRLTDRQLDAIKPAPAGTRRVLWDAVLPNFGVRVTDKGSVSFVLVADGKWTTLGQYPRMGLGAARDAARAALEPQQQPATEADGDPEPVPTFGELAETYIRTEVSRHRAAVRTEAVIRSKLLPALAGRPVDAIRRREVVALVEKIARENGQGAARRAGQHLSAMFNWIVGRDVGLEHNPAARLKALPPAVPRSRVLTDAELRAIWHGVASLGTPWTEMYRTLMLTGQRRGEIAAMRWGEVTDLDRPAPVLNIPAARMKANVAHAVPLTPAVVEMLRKLPRFVGGHHVFTFTGGRRPVGNFANVKLRLDEILGDSVRDWTVHDIRRSVRTGLSTLGIAPHIAEQVIAHTQAGIHKVYDLHRFDAEKRSALLAWEARLMSIVGPVPEVRLLG